MRATAGVLAGVGALALLAACESGPPAWCDAPPGVRTVVAGAPTRWRTPPRLVPLWEVHTDGAGAVFGNPNAVALHPTTGVLAVADHATTTVTLIGPDGTWLHRHAASGRGVGELSFPAALDWLADGRLAVLDVDNHKLLFLSARGAFTDERDLGARARGYGERPGPALQDDVVLTSHRRPVVEMVQGRPNGEPDARPWVELVATRIAWSSGRAETLLQRRVRASAEDRASLPPGEALPMAAPLGDSLVVLAGDTPQLRLRVVDRAGTTVLQLCRAANPLPLSSAESLEVRELGEQVAPEDRARVDRVFTSTDGRIWVQRDRAAGPRLADHWFGPPGAAFDVFAADGVYLGEVRAPADARLVAARGDTVLALRGRHSGDAVVAYRLESVQ